MIRINSVYQWQEVNVGQRVEFVSDHDELRAVRMLVNAPSPAQIYVQQDGEKPYFVARVEGLEEVVFEIRGSYHLMPFGSEIWIDTIDGSKGGLEVVDDASFTTIMTRKVRNPEVEIMERLMHENINRRFAALAAETELLIKKKDAELEAARKAAEDASRQVSEHASGGGGAKHTGKVPRNSESASDDSAEE